MEPWTGPLSPLADTIVRWIILICFIGGLAMVIFGLLFRTVPKPADEEEQEEDP